MEKIHFLWAGAALSFFALFSLGSCGGPKSGRGFHLPEGNGDKGRAAFIQLGCNQCHLVDGIDIPAQPGPIQIKLGGEVYRVKTYGQLVTSIISPSHITNPQYRDQLKGQTMPDLTNAMTVRQMIDIVTFLHARYTKFYPDYRNYSDPYVGPLYPGATRTAP